MVEKSENNPNTKPLSQEEATKQAEQLAREIKKLKSQLKKKTTPSKTEEKIAPKPKEKKKTPPSKTEEKKKTTPSKTEEKKTFEEELEEQLTDEEIENFQIAKVDMDKLTNKVTEILAKYESKGMLQSELWKKLKLTSRDGSRLALKLERMGIISREKILENGRWTYKLIIKKTPISTTSIENAPCLTCPVEQKCTIDGEISPRTCKWIEDWVLVQITPSKKKK
jgi:DNA-binding Lrp family transcriptional regulator